MHLMCSLTQYSFKVHSSPITLESSGDINCYSLCRPEPQPARSKKRAHLDSGSTTADAGCDDADGHYRDLPFGLILGQRCMLPGFMYKLYVQIYTYFLI